MLGLLQICHHFGREDLKLSDLSTSEIGYFWIFFTKIFKPAA